MAGRFLMLTLLLAVEVGCPHTWGREGTIQEALQRDMTAYYAMKDCALPKEEWVDLCETFHERGNNPAAQQLCPLECRPPPPGLP